MMSFWEILKSSKNLKASDAFAELWGKSIADSWDIITITGTLPLTFEAKGEALKTYRLYGTENGAGVETDNLFDKNAKDPNNGYVSGKYLNSSGSYVNQSGFDVSEYIPVDVGLTYYLYWVVDNTSAVGYCFYDENKQFLSGYKYGSKAGTSFTVSSASYIRFSVRTSSSAIYRGVGLYKDAMTVPEPYGYQIPLTNTSGEQSDTYPLYIGSTKLGAEEYVDYQEQKVYKRTENLFNKNAKDTNNGYVANKYLKSTGKEISDASDAISEYIPIKSNTTYKTLYSDTTIRYNSPAVCFYDVNKVYISGTAYSNSNPKSFSTPSDAVYIRFSYRQTYINIVTLYEGADSEPTVYQPYLQPTTPPAPFPAITAYKGENTLSSTETVGEVSVTGKIKVI